MNKHNFLTLSALIFLILTAVLSAVLFKQEKYMLAAVLSAVVSMAPFFLSFEKGKHTTREVVTLSVMIAICVSGRFVFAAIQHFKPVAALVIITGMYFGAEAGFITGSITALVSNMYFGQGPWTVFQMAVWGLIGFLSGLLNQKSFLSKHKAVLMFFSGLCGVIFSLFMDIYTTLSINKSFSISAYLFYISTSIPVMIEYVVSNIVFIFVFEKPLGKKLFRVKTKYGIF